MMSAALRWNRDVVEFLVEKGADAEARDNIGRTALMVAAEGGSLKVVKFLIDRGADINAKERKAGPVTVFMSRLAGILSDRSGTMPMGHGRTALKIAQEKGHKRIVELLKAHGAKE